MRNGKLMGCDLMLIGIMSDSHDNFPGLIQARQIFEERGAELMFHAGDVIAPGMCYAFEGCKIELKLVYGNNDGDRVGLKRDFAKVGAEFLDDFGEIEIDSIKIALLHGTYEPLVRGLVESGRYDVVVRGHDHHVNVVKGETLLILIKAVSAANLATAYSNLTVVLAGTIFAKFSLQYPSCPPP